MPNPKTLNVEIVQPKDLLDAEHGKILYRQVSDLLQQGDVNLILIDCQDIEFVDSSGLGLLVRTLKTVEQHGGRLVLCSLGEGFEMLLKLTRMNDIFEVYMSRVHFQLTYKLDQL